MIEKSRLEELIKYSATIYYADRDVQFPIPIFLNEEDFVREKELSHEESCIRDNILLEDLYEEHKDAEWALKYHATRTEELDLPMFEDFIKEDNTVVKFWKNGHKITLYKYIKNKKTNNIRIMILDDREDCACWKFNKPASEENYKEACDLCLKLFKGEE